jgi:hypothetical protein
MSAKQIAIASESVAAAKLTYCGNVCDHHSPQRIGETGTACGETDRVFWSAFSHSRHLGILYPHLRSTESSTKSASF